MTTPRPISAVIIAQNEADCIAHAVQSCLPFADEVVVVDGGSKDDTIEIARQAVKRVVYQESLAGYANERNYGASTEANTRPGSLRAGCGT